MEAFMMIIKRERRRYDIFSELKKSTKILLCAFINLYCLRIIFLLVIFLNTRLCLFQLEPNVRKAQQLYQVG